MIAEPSPEQRARDGRLAWLIVGACAVLSLTLLVLLVVTLKGFVAREAAASWERSVAEARAKAEADQTAREQSMKDAPWYKPDGETPTDVAGTPPPPNSTRPLGDPAEWVSSDDYPAYAMRNGDEGRVRVTVSAGSDGRPLGCAVAESSGHWSLDNATCAAMLNHGRFAPAPKGWEGRTYWTSPRIRWVLPAD